MPDEPERRLAALLSADVARYSALMAADEAGTVRRLGAKRALIAACVERHRGRIVDAPGDNVLAEFASVVEAVRCALELQDELEVGEVDVPSDDRMRFRIGVHLGDVIVQEYRIYGDGGEHRRPHRSPGRARRRGSLGRGPRSGA